jgi:hypothetical protein
MESIRDQKRVLNVGPVSQPGVGVYRRRTLSLPRDCHKTVNEIWARTFPVLIRRPGREPGRFNSVTQLFFGGLGLGD